MGIAHPRRGLLLVMMEPEEGYADELNAWYDEEHLPERLSCPGFLAARRFELEGAGAGPGDGRVFDAMAPTDQTEGSDPLPSERPNDLAANRGWLRSNFVAC